jgi:O-antigen ligase
MLKTPSWFSQVNMLAILFCVLLALILGTIAASHVWFAVLSSMALAVAAWAAWDSRESGPDHPMWKLFLIAVLPSVMVFQTIDIGRYLTLPLPFSISGRFPILVILFCTALVLVRASDVSHSNQGERPPLLIPFAVSIAVAVLSVVFALEPSRSLVTSSTVQLSVLELAIRLTVSPVFFYAGYLFVSSFDRLKHLLGIVLVLGVINALAGFWQLVLPDSFGSFMSLYAQFDTAGYYTHAESRVVGLWGWAFQSGSFSGLAIFSGLALLGSRRSRLSSIAILCAVILQGLMLLLSGSRAALLSVVLSAGLWFVWMSKGNVLSSLKDRIAFLVALLIGFGGLLYLLDVLQQSGTAFSPQDAVERLLSIGQVGVASLPDFRLLIWEQGIRVFFEHPILGVGVGNYIFYNPLPALMGEGAGALSHSFVIQVLAETGILGGGTIGWLLVSAFKSDVTAYPAQLQQESRLLLSALFAGGLAYLFQSMFDNIGLLSSAWGLLAFFWVQRGAAWSLINKAGRSS